MGAEDAARASGGSGLAGKSLLVYLGAALITLSILIMIGLLGHTDAMRTVAPVETWFVLAALLAPIVTCCRTLWPTR